jgi:hypothetical protein
MKFNKSPQKIEVLALLTTDEKGELQTQEREVLNVDLDGFPGDRHYGYSTFSGGREKALYERGTTICNLRQWSAVSNEEMNEVAQKMGIEELKPEWVGANLLFKGLTDFSSLPSFTRLKSCDPEGAVLIVYEENKPCRLPQPYIENGSAKKAIMTFEKAAKHKRGLVGWVEKPGKIYKGMIMEVWTPK